jgi:hypothetical protein
MADEFSRVYRKGELIFEEGEDGHFACLLREGAVEIFRGHGANLATIATVHPGQLFGELSLVDGGKRMASAPAKIDSKVFLLDEKHFAGKLDGLPVSLHRTFDRLLAFVRETLPYGIARPGEEGAGDPITMEEIGVFIEGFEFGAALAKQDDKFLQSLAELLMFYAKRRTPPR